MAIQNENRTYPEIIEKLLQRGERVVKSEYGLVKAELKDEAQQLLKNLLNCLIFGGLLIAGIVPVLFAAILVLGEALSGQYALAALVVGVIMIGGSWILLSRAIRKLGEEKIEMSATQRSLINV
ncbi:MAG: phage holin family protein [Bdellovibrionota bacterium]